jgi:hypothetical protein
MTKKARDIKITRCNMGSRIGYCVEDSKGRSHILRKQWMSSIEDGVNVMWHMLGGKPDDGSQAIRNDLDIGRGFAACVVSFYSPPFDSIEKNTNCDISDNGLIVIDIKDFKSWEIYHIKIRWEDGKEDRTTLIATKTEDGFTWKVSESKRQDIGEGLC